MIAKRCIPGFAPLACLVLSLVIYPALAGPPPAAAAPLRQADTMLAYDTVVTGQISEDETEQVWVFTGHAGDLIMINMRATSPDLDTHLSLMDPFGNTLFTDDDSGQGFNSRIGPVELPDSGEYTILAGRYGGIGSYTLELSNLNTIPTIVPDKPLVGVVTSEQPTDFFLIEAPTGGGITLWRAEVADDQRYSDPYLTVLGPNGLVASSEAQGETGVLDPIVPVAGGAYVLMVGWNEANTGGPYEIVIRASDRELLTSGSVQNGSFTYDRTFQSHYFYGEVGQQVQITLRTPDPISPALEVRSLDYNAYLLYTDGGYVRHLSTTLNIPQTALYVIDVRNASLDVTEGSYSVELTISGD